jgi:transposase
VIDALLPLRGQAPGRLLADRIYDAAHIRAALRERGIEPQIPEKNRPGQGRSRDPENKLRWPIERTHAWLHNHRRVHTRWERRPELYLAFAQLACALILSRRLDHAF